MYYVDYNCKALRDYERTKKLVEQTGEDTMREVCIEGVLAAKYGFQGDQYTQSVYQDGHSLSTLEGPFDTKSIM